MQIRLLIVLSILQFFNVSSQHVLILGIDGCRVDALEKAHTPHLDSLKAQGIYCPTSWQLGKTKSGPGWSSMLTGVWDEKHQVTDNQFSNNAFANFPFFTSYLKRLDPSKKSAIIVGWKSFHRITKKDGSWDLALNANGDEDGKQKAIDLLKKDTCDVIMIHFNDVDFAGHTTGFEPENEKYIRAIEETDRRIGEILNALRKRPNYKNEDWLILSSTDHGGTGKHHCGNSVQERKIWWLASSNKLQKMEIVAEDPGSYFYENMPVNKEIVKNYPSIVDIAVTALDHLLPNLTSSDLASWGLQGQSWLNFNMNQEDFKDTYLIASKNEKKYFNNGCTIEITVKEFKK